MDIKHHERKDLEHKLCQSCALLAGQHTEVAMAVANEEKEVGVVLGVGG